MSVGLWRPENTRCNDRSFLWTHLLYSADAGRPVCACLQPMPIIADHRGGTMILSSRDTSQLVFDLAASVTHHSTFPGTTGAGTVTRDRVEAGFVTVKSGTTLVSMYEYVCILKNVVATFTPRALDLHAARYWPAGCLQAAAVHYGTRTAAILNVHRFVIKSSLFTVIWIG